MWLSQKSLKKAKGTKHFVCCWFATLIQNLGIQDGMTIFELSTTPFKQRKGIKRSGKKISVGSIQWNGTE